MTEEDILVQVYLSNRKLLGFVVGRLINRTDVNDVLQDAFLKVRKSGRQFSDRQHALRYLKRAAINTALDQLRRDKRLILQETNSIPVGADELDPFSTLLRSEEARKAKHLADQALALLKHLCQEKRIPLALFLNRKWGMFTALSLKLGVPVSTLRSRYLAVLKRLRAEISVEK